jgi:predicted DNA-binding ribbon-helix-helix protein
VSERKRSLSIRGHRTSISLEDEFWDGLKDMAARRGQSVAALVAEIDQARGSRNLSSAIRVAVLAQARGSSSA